MYDLALYFCIHGYNLHSIKTIQYEKYNKFGLFKIKIYIEIHFVILLRYRYQILLHHHLQIHQQRV